MKVFSIPLSRGPEVINKRKNFAKFDLIIDAQWRSNASFQVRFKEIWNFRSWDQNHHLIKNTTTLSNIHFASYCWIIYVLNKKDRRNSGGTLRQKFNLIRIRHLIFDIWTFERLTVWTFEHLNIWTFVILFKRFEWHLYHQLHQWTGWKFPKKNCLLDI